MPNLQRPPRPAVIVAPVYGDPKEATERDAFDPGTKLGTGLLVMAGRLEWPKPEILARVTVTAPQASGSRLGPDPVVLAGALREIVERWKPRDVVAVGREVGEAVGLPRGTPILTWWPSWVLGPDRFALVLPDPGSVRTPKRHDDAVRMRVVLNELWQS